MRNNLEETWFLVHNFPKIAVNRKEKQFPLERKRKFLLCLHPPHSCVWYCRAVSSVFSFELQNLHSPQTKISCFLVTRKDLDDQDQLFLSFPGTLPQRPISANIRGRKQIVEPSSDPDAVFTCCGTLEKASFPCQLSSTAASSERRSSAKQI